MNHPYDMNYHIEINHKIFWFFFQKWFMLSELAQSTVVSLLYIPGG